MPARPGGKAIRGGGASLVPRVGPRLTHKDYSLSLGRWSQLSQQGCLELTHVHHVIPADSDNPFGELESLVEWFSNPVHPRPGNLALRRPDVSGFFLSSNPSASVQFVDDAPLHLEPVIQSGMRLLYPEPLQRRKQLDSDGILMLFFQCRRNLVKGIHRRATAEFV